jgi:hypothetical protein
MLISPNIYITKSEIVCGQCPPYKIATFILDKTIEYNIKNRYQHIREIIEDLKYV